MTPKSQNEVPDPSDLIDKMDALLDTLSTEAEISFYIRIAERYEDYFRETDPNCAVLRLLDEHREKQRMGLV